MSRISMRSFLSRAKRTLDQALAGKGTANTSFVVGNESADLDSITCSLVYAYIQSSSAISRKIDKYWIPIINIPRQDLALRPELTTLLRHADLKPKDLITLDDVGSTQERLPADSTDWTLVDHNVLQGELGKHFCNSVNAVIDHHDDEGKVRQDAQPRIIEKTGSCSSLVVNYCRSAWDDVSGMGSTVGAGHPQGDVNVDDFAYTSTWDAQVAKLALGSILIDTHNLMDENKTTDHDRKAVRYLEAKVGISMKIGHTYHRDSFFKEISDAKSDLDGLSVIDILRKDYKQWEESGLKLGVASVVRSIEYLQQKSENFIAELLGFAESRDLQLFAVMTSHTDSGPYQRQLLFFAMESGKPVELAEKFERDCMGELQLHSNDVEIASTSGQPPWLRFWEQSNLAASRKKVAPMLRECMK